MITFGQLLLAVCTSFGLGALTSVIAVRQALTEWSKIAGKK